MITRVHEWILHGVTIRVKNKAIYIDNPSYMSPGREHTPVEAEEVIHALMDAIAYARGERGE